MKTETAKMELEIQSAEEPVATRRNVPLAIADVDHSRNFPGFPNDHGFTEHSRIQELRNFHGKFTELSWALKYLSHKS